jgi:hypothetical protein
VIIMEALKHGCPGSTRGPAVKWPVVAAKTASI